MPAFQITTEYFLSEYHKFRAIMCRGDVDVEDKLLGYKGLWYVYLNLKIDQPQKEKEMCIISMEALDMELNRRIGLQQYMKIKALILKEQEFTCDNCKLDCKDIRCGAFELVE